MSAKHLSNTASTAAAARLPLQCGFMLTASVWVGVSSRVSGLQGGLRLGLLLEAPAIHPAAPSRSSACAAGARSAVARRPQPPPASRRTRQLSAAPHAGLELAPDAQVSPQHLHFEVAVAWSAGQARAARGWVGERRAGSTAAAAQRKRPPLTQAPCDPTPRLAARTGQRCCADFGAGVVLAPRPVQVLGSAVVVGVHQLVCEGMVNLHLFK